MVLGLYVVCVSVYDYSQTTGNVGANERYKHFNKCSKNLMTIMTAFGSEKLAHSGAHGPTPSPPPQLLSAESL